MNSLQGVIRACLGIITALVVGGGVSVHATSFNVTFDPSTASAPPGFFTAFDDAITFFESNFSDAITINIKVGWGEINGRNLAPGFLGESLTNQQGFLSYAGVSSALKRDARTATDAVAIGSLPTTDPTAGRPFVISNTEAKALGFLPGNLTGTDGWVGFSSSAAYTFDANNRSAPGKYDFIGLADHEISEVMGRYGMTQNGAAAGVYSPLDLFRYSSPGTLDLIPQNLAYFSIDGGKTAINIFNGPGNGGDLSDWLGSTPDSFNAFLSLGRELDVTPGDMTEMDAIGYDAVPEPVCVGLFGVGCLLLMLFVRFRGMSLKRCTCLPYR